ncbi:MAG: sensor histidine kinase [Acutalibacteraceae bacterium]
MKQDRATNFLVILILLAVIVAFAFSYNSSVTTTVANAAYNDKEILQNYNNEIIQKLISQPSTENWSKIVEQYEEIVIVIENSENDVVTKSQGRTWSTLDVKVQTPFQFKGKAYLIKSSVYFLRDYITDVRVLVKFVFVEFLIGISALSLLIFTIYTIMLRPYKLVYKAIEEYDKTGKLKKIKLKGYAGQVYGRFVSMTENLQNHQNNQRRIIASISHDIKTPLTSIMGYSERLKKEGISEDRKRRYLDTVYAKSEEIRHLVDEFDEYLSLNSVNELKIELVSAEDISEMFYREYNDELESAGIKLEIINKAPSDFLVGIDKQKIKRVFGNIISNSVKHMKKEKKLIAVEIYSNRKKLFIDVSDSGEGVDEEKLEMIFEPFYTSDEGRKVAGLGLAICREIVQSHDGKISAGKSAFGGLKISIQLQKAK